MHTVSMMFGSRFGKRLVITSMILVLTACSKSETIELKNPAVQPTGGQQNPEKPGEQKPGQGSSEPAPSTTPSPSPNATPTPGTVQPPAATPVPSATPVAVSRFRVMCERRSMNGLMTFNTSVRPGGAGADVFLSEPELRGGSVTKDDLPLERATNPVLVPQTQVDRQELLFQGHKYPNENGNKFPEQVYFSTVDLLLRIGAAEPIAAMPSVNPNARELARRLGIMLKSFGVSTQSRFLIVPDGVRFKLLSPQTKVLLGTVALDPATTFFPHVDESLSLFTALVYDPSKGSFGQVFATLDLQAKQVGIVGAPDVRGAQAGLTALPSQRFESGTYLWSEVSMSPSRADLLIQARSIDLLTYELRLKRTSRWSFQTASGSLVSPKVAKSVGSGGEALVAIASEAIGPSPGRGRVLKMLEGQVNLVSLSGSRAAVVSQLPYPAVVINHVESKGFDGAFALVSMLSSLSAGGAEELFVGLESRYGHQVFRSRGASQLATMSEDDCVNPSIIEELR